MPLNSFHLKILAPDRVVFDGDVTSVTAPGEAGYFGVLAGHAPFASNLKEGMVEVATSSGARKIFSVISTGFFEVHKNSATLLVSSVAE
jgi:F-type H+-transporting ATPase subunit epsilon